MLAQPFPAAAFAVASEDSVLGPETIEYRVKVIMSRSRERRLLEAHLKADTGVCGCVAANSLRMVQRHLQGGERQKRTDRNRHGYQ